MIEFILGNVFYEVALLLLVAAAVGAGALAFKQPLIVAFIAVGILVGPAGLGWVRSHDQIDLLATLDISLLLFVVGLKLDLHLIRSLGRVALATGLGQVVFTSVIGYAIALSLGMDHIPAIYVAVALTFSSTIISPRADRALTRAAQLAKAHGTTLTVMHVVEPVRRVPADLGTWPPQAQPAELEAKAANGAR